MRCSMETWNVPYQRPSERKYLDSLRKEDPNGWPKMSSEEDSSRFDNVSTLLVGASSIFENVDLLENTIYTQDFTLRKSSTETKKERSQWS